MMLVHHPVCLCIMRTTVTIDDSLIEELRGRAARHGTTVSRLIEDSIRLALSTLPGEAGEAEAFELVTYGRGGRFTDLDIDRTARILEREDLERYGADQR